MDKKFLMSFGGINELYASWIRKRQISRHWRAIFLHF